MCLQTLQSNVINSFDAGVLHNLDNKSTQDSQHFIVQHKYQDFANEVCSSPRSENRPCRGGVTTPFPIRLHDMLDRVEEDGFADVVSWQPHGRCFVVRKPDQFKEILPKYFKLSKITSFQRQLNLYGFSRLTSGKDKGGYYHELFLRGKHFLADNIQRIKVKGTKVRGRSNPNAEPNLWEMSWVGCGSSSANTNTSCIQNDISSAPCSSTPSYSVPAVPCESRPSVESTPLPCPSSTGVHVVEDLDDIVWSFGGNKFHYLDPTIFSLSSQLQTRHTIPSSKPANVVEMDSFISELDLVHLCEAVGSIDDDDIFANMLERVVS